MTFSNAFYAFLKGEKSQAELDAYRQAMQHILQGDPELDEDPSAGRKRRLHGGGRCAGCSTAQQTSSSPG